MSKADILAELPRLSAEDRAEIQMKLDELAGGAWLDAGETTDEKKRFIESRVDHCEGNPSAFVPWSEAKSQILGNLRIEAQTVHVFAVIHAARHHRQWTKGL